jgi:hypothetical protein
MSHKVLIFVPAFGNMLNTATFLATHALAQQFFSRGIAYGVAGHSFPDIAELREMAITIFHDSTDFSHLLFIDADMAFPPELVLEMLLFDEPVVGTIYRQRKDVVSWAGSGNGRLETTRRGNFMQVEGVGMGISLIRRDAISTMIQRLPHLVDTRLDLHPAKDMLASAGIHRLLRFFEKMDAPGRGIISEDLSFCIRWAECGGQVWGAVGHRISHVGMYDFAGRFLDSVEEAHAKQAAEEQARRDREHGSIQAPATEALIKTQYEITEGVARLLNGGGQHPASPSA